MANSFLQDALRQQNAQRMQGRMMQQEVERLIGRQITGQIGAQEFNSDTQRTQARTQALESAENRSSQRDTRRTEFEMKKDQAIKNQKAGLVSAIAKSTADLIGFMATQKQPGEAPGFDAGVPRDYKLGAGENFQENFARGQEVPLVESPGKLDASLPMGFTEPLAAPDMQLKLSPSTVGSFNEGEAGYVPMGSQRDPFGNPRIDTSFNRATADYTANLEAEELEKLLMSIPQQ